MLLGHSALEAEIWGLSGKIPPSHFSCYSGKKEETLTHVSHLLYILFSFCGLLQTSEIYAIQLVSFYVPQIWSFL